MERKIAVLDDKIIDLETLAQTNRNIFAKLEDRVAISEKEINKSQQKNLVLLLSIETLNATVSTLISAKESQDFDHLFSSFKNFSNTTNAEIHKCMQQLLTRPILECLLLIFIV